MINNKNVKVVLAAALIMTIFFAGNSSAKIIAENALVDFTSEIIFDPDNPDKQPAVFTSGEIVKVRVETSLLSDCGDCIIRWSSDSDYIFFQNIVSKSHYQEATMVISSNLPIGKNVLVSVTAKHNNWERKIAKEIRIISNTAPTVVPVFPKEKNVPSFSYFDVDCRDSKSGKNTEEYGDRVWRCKVTVMDEAGKIIFSKQETAKPGEKIPLVRVKSGAVGINFVDVEIEDTLGSISIVREMINVGLGSTNKDFPDIIIGASYNCRNNSECVFDAGETFKLFPNATGFIYEEITGGVRKPVYTQKGLKCLTYQCNAYFNTSGTKVIEVRAKLSGKTKEGKKIFIANVGESSAVYTSIASMNQKAVVPSSPQVQTVAQTSLTQQISPAEICAKTPSRCKETPGIGGFALTAILIAVVQIIKKKK